MSTATEMIQFYDIPSKVKGSSWSPNARKIRYALNYKKLPHKTIWVEYPDIAPTCKKIGAPPSATKPDGSPYYSVPFIKDSNTGRALSDSVIIIQYLETTYPSPPERSLIPPGTLSLQLAFLNAFDSLVYPLYYLCIPASAPILNKASMEFYLEARRGDIFEGRTVAEADPKGEDRVKQWKKVQNGFEVVNSWLKPEDKFFGDERVLFVDLVLASYLGWIRLLWGEESHEWKDVSSWNGGRWAALVKNLEEHTTVL